MNKKDLENFSIELSNKMKEKYVPRDINRIDIILEQLSIFWKNNYDLRLGQLLFYLSQDKDLFMVEDSYILERLEKLNENK